MDMIYKVVARDAWQAACESKVFSGAAIDVQDGFIHFSTATQVKETVSKHFHGQDDLLLIAFRTESLGPALKWEVSRGGALFPHLYAPLATDLAVECVPLTLNADGSHEFPEDFPN